MLGEATLDVSGTFAGEAIRVLIPFAARHTAKRYTFSVGDKIGSLTIATPIFCGTA